MCIIKAFNIDKVWCLILQLCLSLIIYFFICVWQQDHKAFGPTQLRPHHQPLPFACEGHPSWSLHWHFKQNTSRIYIYIYIYIWLHFFNFFNLVPSSPLTLLQIIRSKSQTVNVSHSESIKTNCSISCHKVTNLVGKTRLKIENHLQSYRLVSLSTCLD